MATTVTRIYKGKDAEMLTVSSTIIQHAINNKPFLITKRANWADPFFGDIQTRIDRAFSDFLGIDNAKLMREATQIVLQIQARALPLLAEFKIQITEDFTNPRKNEILNQLGFTQHHKAAQQRDQEALIELLYKFKTNMTPALQTEITSAGTDLGTITDIISLAQQLKESDVSQEALKGGRKEISAAGVTEFNAIYKTVISIAKISAKFFIKDKPKAQAFSYSRNLKALNAPPQPTPNP